MAALSIGFFVSLLDQSMVAVALTDIQHSLGIGLNELTWVSSAYLLAVVVPLLLAGRMGDVYGPRRMFRIGLTLFGLGAVACALAPNAAVLITARAVQGLGASLQMPQSLAVINRVFHRSRRGRALGMWGIIGSVASLAGPLLGGFLVGAFGWRAVFWVHVPLAILAVWLAGRWVPVLRSTSARLDVGAAAVSLVALGGIVMALQQGPAWGWNFMVWAFLAVGVAAGAVFAWMQFDAARAGRAPLVPPALFGAPNYAPSTAAIVAMGFMAASMMIPLMYWLQSAGGLSAEQAGLVVAPMALVSMFVSPAAGALADVWDPRRLATTGFVVLMVCYAAAWWLMHAGAPAWSLALVAAVIGLGQSLIWGSNAATAMRDVPAALMGAASGVYNTARQVGSVVGVAAVGAAMQSGHVAGSLLVIVGALGVGLVASLFLRRTLHS